MYGDYKRAATAAEVANYETVNKVFDTMDINLVLTYYDKILDYLCAYVPTARRKAYSKVRYIAKKYGFTVPMLIDWACIDD